MNDREKPYTPREFPGLRPSTYRTEAQSRGLARLGLIRRLPTPAHLLESTLRESIAQNERKAMTTAADIQKQIEDAHAAAVARVEAAKTKVAEAQAELNAARLELENCPRLHVKRTFKGRKSRKPAEGQEEFPDGTMTKVLGQP